MNGDWKDQKLNQHYQNDIRQQAVQDALAENLQGEKQPLHISIVQPLWHWLTSRKPLIAQSIPLTQTQELKAVK